MYCTHCNHQNPEGTKFCEACGKSITGITDTPKPQSNQKLIGILTMVAGGMILLGYILPWFSINVFGVGGRFSGLTALIAATGALIASFFGTGSALVNNIEGAGIGGGLLIVLLLIFIAFILVPPFMGVKILQTGIRLYKSPQIEVPDQKIITKKLYRLAIIGGIPLLCYLSLTALQVASFDLFGLIQFKSTAAGFWVTAIGFILAIVAGVVF